ncbi:MAG: S41 family peptidase [Bacteroidales bacterium]
MKLNHKTLKLYLPIILSVALIAGILLGILLGGNRPGKKTYVYNHPNKLNSVLNYIQKNYVDSVSEKEIQETAIPAILKDLDPHSVYIPAEDLENVNEPLKGNFEGIGIQFSMQEDTLVVISVISGGPSEKVGLHPGDRIIKVNDTTIAGVNMSTNKIVSMLKGEQGSKVDVTVDRGSSATPLEFTITRDEIPLYSVDVSYMLNPATGYIKIDRFAKSTHQEFTNSIKKLKENALEKVIIDLRGNSGGFLKAATNIADEFLEDGKLIVYTQGRNSVKNEIHSTSRGICEDLDVAVLIDEWSASASEIIAGAIQDNDRGIVVGRRSFGKGLVQEQNRLSDGSAIRLTVARYYTPTGRCIQRPYENGREQYYNDLNERFNHGEFFNVDSIELADSLKYETPKGDIVYGGGGIMPDYFVPVDTSYHSPLFNRVTNEGLIYSFAFRFADNHRSDLTSLDEPKDINQYLENNNIYSQFLDYVFDMGVPRDIEGIKKSKKIINTRLKAYIARNIMENEGFYPIIREVDETLEKAFNLLEEGKKS